MLTTRALGAAHSMPAMMAEQRTALQTMQTLPLISVDCQAPRPHGRPPDAAPVPADDARDMRAMADIVRRRLELSS